MGGGREGKDWGYRTGLLWDGLNDFLNKEVRGWSVHWIGGGAFVEGRQLRAVFCKASSFMLLRSTYQSASTNKSILPPSKSGKAITTINSHCQDLQYWWYSSINIDQCKKISLKN